jgi:uncharacterized lipoprotein YbaY
MRPLPLILLGCLLSGCANPPVADRPEAASTEKTVHQTSAQTPEAAKNQQQLSGTLLTPAPDSVVELAILLVDAQGRARELVKSFTLHGTGQALPFALTYDQTTPATDQRLQLRARVSVSRQLVQRLPGQFIKADLHSNLGTLKLVSAP